jgi:hypothetical protein
MQSAKQKSESAYDPWSFLHPFTPEDAAAMTDSRSAVAGMKGKLEGIAARAPFNGIIERVEAPEGVTFEEDTVGGISGRGGPSRRRVAKKGQSFTCTAAGSTGEQPRHSASWRATSP